MTKSDVKNELTSMTEFQYIPSMAVEEADKLSVDELNSMSRSDAVDMCINLAMMRKENF